MTCIQKKKTHKKVSTHESFSSRSLNVSTVMELKTRQDFVILSTTPLYTLCYHGMFKYSKWKPALALLITRNALSEYPSKTWVLKSMPSRSHKACELFVLLVQPVCLRSSFSGRAKLAVLKRKGMCKNKGRKGGGKTVFSGKWSLNFRAMVQYYNHTDIVHGISGIWTCLWMKTSAYMRTQTYAHITVWGHWGHTVFQFVIRF